MNQAAQLLTITCVADVSGSLNSKYFKLPLPFPNGGAYVWFNVNSAGIDPRSICWYD
jgi:hypothetical protein